MFKLDFKDPVTWAWIAVVIAVVSLGWYLL